MSDERCDECRFWVETGDEDVDLNVALGHCKRFPPALLKREPEFDGHDWQGWGPPVLIATDWCGEFKARDRDCNITIHGAPAGTTVTHDEQTRTVNIALASALHEVVNAIAIHKGPVWNAIRRHQK